MLSDTDTLPEGTGSAPPRPAGERPQRPLPDEPAEARAPPPPVEDERQDAKDGATREGLFKRHPLAVGAGVLVLLAVIVGGVLWWLNARHFESTDDAFVDARTVSVSAQVSGLITNVPVTDNQVVDAGATLASIDNRDYIAARDQAKAQIDQAQASIANFAAQIDAQQSQIDQAAKQITETKAALAFSEQENTRYQDLLQKGAGTAQRAQQATSDLTQRQAAVASAEAAKTGAEKQIAVLEAQRRSAAAQLEAAKAQLDQAEANVSRTTVVAPLRGRVTRLSAAKGNYATPGQALMVLVPLDVWVTANFKETQLTDMHPGQAVTVSVDAYPAHDFGGHVDSIQAGSGTAFSLLPAENATGNYVKVVQRVPVKIVFDKLPDVHLGPGMSVVPSVTVR